MSIPTPPPKPPPGNEAGKSKFPVVLLALLGCSGVALISFLVCGGLAFVGMRWGMQKVNTFAAEFEAQGYRRQFGQVIQVGESPAEKTVYVCQVLRITKEVDVDIAIASQVAEIEADIHGNVDFFGQVMKVKRGTMIDGDLHIHAAQAVEIDGEVKGKITGSYGVLNYRNQTFTGGMPPEPPNPPAAPVPALTPEMPVPLATPAAP